ncbi:MAG TPA: phage major capsid protein [Terracidiphilus sp.]
MISTSKAQGELRNKTNTTWRAYFKGRLDTSLPEHRDLLSTSDGTGGAFVPQEFQTGFIAQALKAYAPLADFSRTRISKNGRPVKTSTVDDRANGMTLYVEGSGATIPEVDPSYASSTTSTDLFTTGQIKYSIQLLEDSEWDLETHLSNLASIRYGRGLERILTRGTDFSGTATPNNAGLMNIATVATTTTSLSASIGWTDLVNTFDALDAAYLPKGIWQMTSKTRNALVEEKDGFGRPYFTPAPNMGGFDMLLGRPIVINQSLDQLTVANGIPVLFGSLFDGFEIVGSELSVRVLHEHYALTLEQAMIVSTRVGSTALAPGAIQALKLAAA